MYGDDMAMVWYGSSQQKLQYVTSLYIFDEIPCIQVT